MRDRGLKFSFYTFVQGPVALATFFTVLWLIPQTFTTPPPRPPPYAYDAEPRRAPDRGGPGRVLFSLFLRCVTD